MVSLSSWMLTRPTLEAVASRRPRGQPWRSEAGKTLNRPLPRPCHHAVVIGIDWRGLRALAPLLLVSGVVALVAFGQARGLWLSNLHNGLLALAFTFVGTYVLIQRPGHREGQLFLATGVVEALLFFGRQIGHSPSSPADRWWGWLGVWPLVIALALTTLSVICFPDGRLPSPPWRWVVGAGAAVTGVCATLSAIWPVEYLSAGVITTHPVNSDAPAAVSQLWSIIAHPAYIGFQLLWVVAVASRWRTSGGHVRGQLTWLVGAAAISVGALVTGLAVWGTPRPGLLSATLMPLAAGWAIVHGQHAAAYSALTWLSRTGAESADLPNDLAQAVAEALVAPGAMLWMGGDDLHAVGLWPATDQQIEPTTLVHLRDAADRQMRPVSSHGTVVGAISIDRARA